MRSERKCVCYLDIAYQASIFFDVVSFGHSLLISMRPAPCDLLMMLGESRICMWLR